MLVNNKKAVNRQTHTNKQSQREKEKEAVKNAGEPVMDFLCIWY